jgi:hypothetical protein
MSTKSNSSARNLKPLSCDTVIVGKKTHAAIEEEWLKEFHASRPVGRPEGDGWLTLREMAQKAGCDEQAMKRFIERSPKTWEMEWGTTNVSGVNRRVMFWRRRP